MILSETMIKALPGTSYQIFNHQFDSFEEAMSMIAKALDCSVLTPGEIVKISWKFGKTPQEVEEAWKMAMNKCEL